MTKEEILDWLTTVTLIDTLCDDYDCDEDGGWDGRYLTQIYQDKDLNLFMVNFCNDHIEPIDIANNNLVSDIYKPIPVKRVTHQGHHAYEVINDE